MELSDFLGDSHKEVKEDILSLSSREQREAFKKIEDGRVKPRDQLFHAIEQINFGKKRVTVAGEHDRFYSQFTVNNALSQHIDTVMFAYQMNLCQGMSDQMHFDYLLHSVRSGKRYGKWATLDEGAEIELVVVLMSRHLEINREKCRFYYHQWSKSKLDKFKSMIKPRALDQIDEILKTYKKAEVNRIRAMVNRW